MSDLNAECSHPVPKTIIEVLTAVFFLLYFFTALQNLIKCSISHGAKSGLHKKNQWRFYYQPREVSEIANFNDFLIKKHTGFGTLRVFTLRSQRAMRVSVSVMHMGASKA